MKIQLENVGLHFKKQWIFKNINQEIAQNDVMAFLGKNGSGKSSLLKICAAYLSPSAGNVSFIHNEKAMSSEHIFAHCAIASPWIELIEEMTLMEFFSFHFSFKKNKIPIKEIIQEIDLSGKENEYLQNFSSGMLQRVKLAQAFYADTAILLLDEPLSNLDSKGFELYQDLINKYTKDRIVCIASNEPKEYINANKFIHLS